MIDFLKRKELGLPVWAWGLVVAVVLFYFFYIRKRSGSGSGTVDTLSGLTTGTPASSSGGAGSLSPLTPADNSLPLVGTGAGDLTGASQDLTGQLNDFLSQLDSNIADQFAGLNTATTDPGSIFQNDPTNQTAAPVAKEKPIALNWGGKQFSSKAQFKAWAKTHGTSVAAVMALHPAAALIYSQLPSGGSTPVPKTKAKKSSITTRKKKPQPKAVPTNTVKKIGTTVARVGTGHSIRAGIAPKATAVRAAATPAKSIPAPYHSPLSTYYAVPARQTARSTETVIRTPTRQAPGATPTFAVLNKSQAASALKAHRAPAGGF